MNEMIILKIKDRKYGMRKMPPLKGSQFGVRVASVLSKALSDPRAKEALESLKSKMGLDADKIESLDNESALTAGSAIIGLISTIPANEINSIFSEAFSYEVYFEDKKLSDELTFDLHFQRYPQDLYVVAIWSIFHNVKDFFSGIGDGLKALMPNSVASKMMESQSQSNVDLIGH